MNAREAMHLIELRSGREGHASYRAVASRMHELIAAVHPGVAAAMIHRDRARSRASSGSRRSCEAGAAGRPRPARASGERS